MKLVLQKSFLKNYKKLPNNIKGKFRERAQLLLDEPSSPILRVHKLKGDMIPLQSMNVTGDYRALFIWDTRKKTITFYMIGTHSDLYN